MQINFAIKYNAALSQQKNNFPAEYSGEVMNYFFKQATILKLWLLFSIC